MLISIDPVIKLYICVMGSVNDKRRTLDLFQGEVRQFPVLVHIVIKKCKNYDFASPLSTDRRCSIGGTIFPSLNPLMIRLVKIRNILFIQK